MPSLEKDLGEALFKAAKDPDLGGSCECRYFEATCLRCSALDRLGEVADAFDREAPVREAERRLVKLVRHGAIIDLLAAIQLGISDVIEAEKLAARKAKP